MYQGNWTCSECGAAITELPFEPSGDRPLTCKECHKKRMAERGSSRPRQMFQGNWTCSECGAPITELPFQPSGDRPLTCRDCHKAKMATR
jgi:CxxC-x17-CxxC domain-containing protein